MEELFRFPTYCDNEQLKNLILDAKPSKNGLFPHEIVMLLYTSYGQYTTQNRSYSSIWQYQLSVKYPENLFRSLIARGYIRECSNDELLDCLKMQDIKKLLTDKKIRCGKTKEESKCLVKQYYSGEEIYAECKIRYYVLSELGKSELENNADIASNPYQAWEINCGYKAEGYLSESQIQILDTHLVALFVDSENYSGKLILTQFGTEIWFKTSQNFDTPVTISIYIGNKKIWCIELVSQIFLLSNERKILLCKHIDDKTTRCICYDLVLQEEVFQETIQRTQLVNPEIPEDQYEYSQMSNTDKGIVRDSQINYYFSINDITAETVIINYIGKRACIKKLPRFIPDDVSTNYKVTVPNSDSETQRLIMYMIQDNKLANPAIMGISIPKILNFLRGKFISKTRQVIMDNILHDDKSIAEVVQKITHLISDNWKEVYDKLEKIYPPRIIISYDPYRYYTCPTIYDKDENYYYAVQNKEAYQKKYIGILKRLMAEGVISPKWKSEFSLFLMAESYFSDAVFQYHADWLGSQSLDIFLPTLKIGIEYQGIQHYEPVEIFGGQIGLENSQARDKRKRQLCISNGIHLLEWPYTMDINDDLPPKVVQIES